MALVLFFFVLEALKFSSFSFWQVGGDISRSIFSFYLSRRVVVVPVAFAVSVLLGVFQVFLGSPSLLWLTPQATC